MVDLEAKYCGRCGYELIGLPKQGRCPECGQVYDLVKGSGLGVGPKHRVGTGIGRMRTVACGVLAVVVMLCGGLGALVATHPLSVLWISGFISGVCILALITSYLYESEG